MPDNVTPPRQLTMSTPAAYLIRVRGWLDESWSDYFDNLSIVVSASKGTPPETTLCGQVPDQAALVAILRQLGRLQTKLISVERLAQVTNE